MNDLLIIGGGPAAVAAGIYAGRKKLKTALVADKFGGQSVVAADIENWIGTKNISGVELASNLEEHLRAQEVEIIDNDLVEKIEKIDGGFKATTKAGKTVESKTILITSGSHRRKMGVPGEDKYEGKGVSYCSTCDAPLFKDKVVAVIGAGNAGLEAARDLLSYAKKIYILSRDDKVAGDPVTFEEINKDDRIELIKMAQVKEVFGEAMLTGLKYEDGNTKEVKELQLGGIFVEIGSVPNSDFVKDLVKLNNRKEIETDSNNQMSSLKGIWAAGDVDNGMYKQNNVAVGDAIKAVLNINDFLNKNK